MVLVRGREYTIDLTLDQVSFSVSVGGLFRHASSVIRARLFVTSVDFSRRSFCRG